MLRSLAAITHNTFTEALRKPIFLALTLVGMLLLVLCPSLASYSIEAGDGDNKMLLELGLGSLGMVCLLLAAFSAPGILVREIEEKTVLTVVSKPVPRPALLLGKFLGIGAAVTLAYVILSCTFLLMLRHKVLQNYRDEIDGPVAVFGTLALLGAAGYATAVNYLQRRPFTSNMFVALGAGMVAALLLVLVMDKDWHFQSPLAEFSGAVAEGGAPLREAALSLLFIVQGLWIMCAVALAFSARLSQVPAVLGTVLVGVAAMVIAPISQGINASLGIERIAGPAEAFSTLWHSPLSGGTKAVYFALKGAACVLPNLQLHWPTDAFARGGSLVHLDAHGEGFSLSYLARVSAYSALQVTGILALATALFQRREVG